MNKFNPNYYSHLDDDSAMIQGAIDAARDIGETIVIPRYNMRTKKNIWEIVRPINLHTFSVVCINNAHLRLANGVYSNMFRTSNIQKKNATTIEDRQYDISIYGLGNAILDGGMHNGLVEKNANTKGRPSIRNNTMILFSNAERVTIKDIRILHQRHWGMTFYYCSSCSISNIDFFGGGNAPNQDGIDLRRGCNNFVIDNISGFTQDDSIALTCLASPRDMKFNIDSMDSSIHNVIIKNITTATMCAKVRLLSNDGCKLYNIIIENLQDFIEFDITQKGMDKYKYRLPYSDEYFVGSETSMALKNKYWRTFEEKQIPIACVRIGENHYFQKDEGAYGVAKIGDIFNITIRNIQTRAKFGVMISATLADSFIDNVQMFGENINAVYFEKGDYSNIRLSNISYARSSKYLPDKKNKDCVVYFNNANCNDLYFNGITTRKSNEAVFEGDSDVNIYVRDIIYTSKQTKLSIDDNINIIEL